MNIKHMGSTVEEMSNLLRDELRQRGVKHPDVRFTIGKSHGETIVNVKMAGFIMGMIMWADHTAAITRPLFEDIPTASIENQKSATSHIVDELMKGWG